VDFGTSTFDSSEIVNWATANANNHNGLDTGGLFSAPVLQAVWPYVTQDYSPAWLVQSGMGSHCFILLRFKMSEVFGGSGGSNIKVFRLSDPNNGGIFARPDGSWGFGFDAEISTVPITIGVFEASRPAWFNTEVGASYIVAENIADGNWHDLEFEYDRNAGANVECRAWFDQTPVIMPAGDVVSTSGDVYTTAAWVGGDAGTDTPTTLRATRSGGTTLGDTLALVEEMSTNPNGTGSGGDMEIDWVGLSTARIGVPR
jgi:hypothetical protein